MEEQVTTTKPVKEEPRDIGQKVYDMIKNDYILNGSFAEDAIEYVYHVMYDNFNQRMAQLGCDMANVKPEDDGTIKIPQDIIEQVETCSEELAQFRIFFKRVFNFSPDFLETSNIQSDLILGRDEN